MRNVVSFLVCWAALGAAFPTGDRKIWLERGKPGACEDCFNFADPSTDVSSTLLLDMELFSQYSAVAYCNDTYTSAPAILRCSSGNCPLVEASNATTMSIFSDPISGLLGYVGIDPKHSLIVLAFQGSANIRNYFDDFDFAFIPCDLVVGCLVHSGFWEAWTATREPIFAGVAIAIAAHPSYTVIATGHSLGAAVATLAAAELRANGTSVDLYNYGSPRVGNDVFANFVTNQTALNVRVTHTDDPVANLPPIWLFYRHISPEYWIQQGDVNVTTNDIEVLYGIANTEGNAGQTDFNATAHVWYFGPITACEGDLTFK